MAEATFCAQLYIFVLILMFVLDRCPDGRTTAHYKISSSLPYLTDLPQTQHPPPLTPISLHPYQKPLTEVIGKSATARGPSHDDFGQKKKAIKSLSRTFLFTVCCWWNDLSPFIRNAESLTYSKDS